MSLNNSTALRNDWEDGGWKWLCARSGDGLSLQPENLSDTAYSLCVDYVYTGADSSGTYTVNYNLSGDTDGALSVDRSESGALPNAAGRYSVSAEVYVQIPGDSTTRTTLWTFPAVIVDLTA